MLATTWTLFSARKSTRSCCPGSRSTVRLQRSSTSLPCALACSTMYLKCELSSGAPPVMSTTSMLGEAASSSTQRSAVFRSIISVRRGDDSTWQWEQAWLQYRPMLSWKVLVTLRLRGVTPLSARTFWKDGTLSLSRERWRAFCSSRVSSPWPFSFRAAMSAWASPSAASSCRDCSTRDPSALKLLPRPAPGARGPRTGLLALLSGCRLARADCRQQGLRPGPRRPNGCAKAAGTQLRCERASILSG
mmetsp:Transcript_26067/g.72985  ORF Transcript_26067/g.72985 Transcript_26067/m.72985 type:complete len:247 (-) Transcript_26067:37-777(-)